MSIISRLLESLFLLLFSAIFYGSHLFFVFAVASLFQLVISPELLPFWAAITLGIIPADWFLVLLNKHTKDDLGIIANAVIIGIIVLVLTPLFVKVKNDVLQHPGLPPVKAKRAL